ncbi:hypothetical protein [uncultured Helicobacter sp.]|nr:hypothetical protein [uncultured Helicobacter sp.]
MNLLGLDEAKAEFHRQKTQIQHKLKDFGNAIEYELNTLLQNYFKEIE